MSSYTAEDVDEDIVVLNAPSLVGLIVMPSRHVSELAELPPPERARVLAALRRVSAWVEAEYHGSAPRIVVTTDPPASEGHVGFQVVPRSRPRGFDT
jgi:diadenosine tetraphosphate (Ap4A) HIT family hydrolase